MQFFLRPRFAVPALILSAFAIALFAAFSLYPRLSHAQTSPDIGARRAQLQAQLNDLEKQIAQTQGTLTTLKGQGQSIQRDINIINANIKKTQLQIRATQVQIDALSQNIVVHSNTIGVLTGDIESEKASLAQIIRSTREIDDSSSLIEVVLSSDDVSSFFSDLDSYVSLKQALGNSSSQLMSTRTAQQTEKDALTDQKAQQEALRAEQASEQATLKSQEAQKAKLLAENKSQTAHYQTIYDTQQKTAAQIRAELFALAGGSGQIPLPTAITLAKAAGAATGVRPALILGILKQETNLGQNVGQCLLTNSPNMGDGKGKNTGTPFSGVMKPTRDVQPFMTITQTLGISWQSQPVSCPPSYGYGGAMGPGQFIPSTWMLLASRVSAAAGHPGTFANPWNNMDAFTATAILMADNGATAKTPYAEREAALRYFAGWGNADNPAYSFYGDSVMGFAAQFQSDIDTLSGS